MPWIVLPTYNEADNIAGVIAAAQLALPEAQILVVDDSSPDGTAEIAAAIAGVEVLVRPEKGGYGPAYIAGFARALSRGASEVFQMDADLSHDPADLPRLLAAVRGGADIAIGSRYVAGGGVENWPLRRRLLSRAGGTYARTLLGLGVKDPTGGFKCYRPSALEAVDYQTLKSQGYTFQVEIAYRSHLLGMDVVEVPITFRERIAGTSKMSMRIAFEAAWMVPTVRRTTQAPGVRSAAAA
jgi:dolichol-phosphate mannosyltransferase